MMNDDDNLDINKQRRKVSLGRREEKSAPQSMISADLSTDDVPLIAFNFCISSVNR